MSPERLSKMLEQHKAVIVHAGDKHDDSRYLATTLDEVRDACCEIIRNRKDYYWAPTMPPAPELSETDIAKLPEGAVKAAANNQHAIYKRDLRDFQRDRAAWNALQKAAKEGDLSAALFALESRSGYEYEGFSIEPATKAHAFVPFELK
jgi:hypothetical protein